MKASASYRAFSLNVASTWGRVPGRTTSRRPYRSRADLLEHALQVLREAGGPLPASEIAKRVSPPRDRLASFRQLLVYEASKDDGQFIRGKEGYDLRSRVKRSLRAKVRHQIRQQGLPNTSQPPVAVPLTRGKAELRVIHGGARSSKYEAEKDFLAGRETDLLRFFADGTEVDPVEFDPQLEIVRPDSLSSDLFRYASLLWSVPVSQGYGRRIRFLVWDASNTKLVGIFALGDPVFNLRCRDAWVGWDHRAREKRLYNVMDIFVLGAVPPYNQLLAGKLIAMLAATNEVQEIVERRYRGRETVIAEERKDPRLALLTTSSALGKSSLYDRIRFHDRPLYIRIGLSEGFGHFHLNHGLFEHLRDYLEASSPGSGSRHRFGQGPNWKLRTAREALKQIGLPGDLLRHGIRREVYAIPLASNVHSFLWGDATDLEKYCLLWNETVAFWRQRWFLPRASRVPEFVKHRRQDVSRQVHAASASRTRQR